MRKPPARVVYPVITLLIVVGIILTIETAATTPVEQPPTPAPTQTLAPTRKIAPKQMMHHIPKETPTPTPENAPQPEIQPHTEEIAEPAETEPPYTEEEREMLALIIYQEAGGDACSDETRLMVGTVVMNRIADNRFPDTMYEVITARAQYGRLYWTGLAWPERATNPGEAHAVERAYTIAERILQGERALPEDVVFQAEFEQGTETVAEQDGFYFCR